MTRRYGRNQRRAHRERIHFLGDALDLAKAQHLELARRANRAEHQLGEAAAIALNQWLKDANRVDIFIDELKDRLVEAIEPELRTSAKTVLDAVARQSPKPPFSLDAYQSNAFDAKGTFTVLRGRLGNIEWRVALDG